MRVVLHAVGGGAQAQDSVGIAVLPSDAIAGDSASTGATSPSPSAGTPVLHLSSNVGRAGETIVVRVDNARGDVHIELNDESGVLAAEGDPALPTAPLALRLPAVSVATKYMIVATVTRGNSEQSIVHPIVVTP